MANEFENTTSSVMEEEPKWYVLHTISGYENIAEQNLKLTIEKFGLQNRIFKIVIPVEERIEEKKGKRVIVTEKLLPTYIFVKMIYGDDIWHNITRTRGITGFVGPKGRPLALTPEEIKQSKLEDPEDNIIRSGDVVEVIDGPMAGVIGRAISVYLESGKCVIGVEVTNDEDMQYEVDISQLKKHNITEKKDDNE